jgi:YVTN family beta-propeller protein
LTRLVEDDEIAGLVIDPGRQRVTATITVGHRPQGIAVVGGSVWVTVEA